ncbi:hypothetical protein ZONE111905_07310 [Zobellia nedashkovskayae]
MLTDLSTNQIHQLSIRCVSKWEKLIYSLNRLANPTPLSNIKPVEIFSSIMVKKPLRNQRITLV